MEEKLKIASWFAERNLPIVQTQVDKLSLYLEMIREASKKMNMVSKNDLPNLAERHLFDSLHALVVFEFPVGSHVADFGSGAGFPGVPLAIARPDLNIELIESRRLKGLFLKGAIEVLGLEHAKVINDRWENFNTKYDIILARAVYAEIDLRKIALPRLNENGALLYYAKFNDIRIIRNSKT
jgi:16S rRNA (guanine527-N7)-methyltransferase